MCKVFLADQVHWKKKSIHQTCMVSGATVGSSCYITALFCYISRSEPVRVNHTFLKQMIRQGMHHWSSILQFISVYHQSLYVISLLYSDVTVCRILYYSVTLMNRMWKTEYIYFRYHYGIYSSRAQKNISYPFG